MKAQLQQLRKSKGLTQEEIASILDVKLSTYQKYERDAISPPYDTLIKIADFYDVTTDYLLGREPKVPEPNPFAEMNLSKDDEKEVMEKYMAMPEEVRAIMLNVIRELGAVMNKPEHPMEMRQSTMVAVETAGEFRQRKEAEAAAEAEAQRKETA